MIWTVKYIDRDGQGSGHEMFEAASREAFLVEVCLNNPNTDLVWLKQGDHMPYAHQGPVYEPPVCKKCGR